MCAAGKGRWQGRGQGSEGSTHPSQRHAPVLPIEANTDQHAPNHSFCPHKSRLLGKESKGREGLKQGTLVQVPGTCRTLSRLRAVKQFIPILTNGFLLPVTTFDFPELSLSKNPKATISHNTGVPTCHWIHCAGPHQKVPVHTRHPRSGRVWTCSWTMASASSQLTGNSTDETVDLYGTTLTTVSTMDHPFPF